MTIVILIIVRLTTSPREYVLEAREGRSTSPQKVSFPLEVISTPSPAVIFSKLLINIRISKVCKSANISLIHFIGMYLKMDLACPLNIIWRKDPFKSIESLINSFAVGAKPKQMIKCRRRILLYTRQGPASTEEGSKYII